jgi:DNA mismatch repair protein MutL
MKRIYPLPPSLTNQIAAGEVIERPASVVKELLENALDAGAKHISIHIEAGGVQLIEIMDDGMGIHPDDLPLAVMSHATSKIRTLDDLFSVQSLGFRGEALASISAVSRFSILSKTKRSDGYELTFDGIKQKAHVLPKACSQGTTISVKDLFFNTPVRRKFLSSEKTEWLQIEQVIKRVALSRFDVTFQLKHKTTLYLPAVHHEMGIDARVRKIFGSAFLEQSRKIEAKVEDIRLWGWVGLPSLMRSQNDLQYVYLNGRMIRDKLITHAIRAAYDGLLYPGRQPIFLLYLEMPPEAVDVNVHPTKHEVRFQEPRQIHDFVHRELVRVLRDSTHLSESTQECIQESNEIQEVPAMYRASSESTMLSKSSLDQNLHLVQTYSKTFNHPAVNHPADLNTSLNIQWLEYPYCLMLFKGKWLLCNYVRLYQNLCKQHFLESLEKNNVISRPLLVPVRLTVPTQLLDILLSNMACLEKLGLSMNRVDEKIVFIRAFPAVTPHLDFNQWIQNCSELLETKVNCIENIETTLINSLVCTNQPTFPISSIELKSVLADFEYQLMQPSISKDLKQCYRVMTLDDWKALLKNS